MSLSFSYFNMEFRVLSLVLLSTSILADDLIEVNSTTESAEQTTVLQCDKSLYTKGDLKLMVEYVENSLSIQQKINDTVQQNAIPVQNKYILRLQSYMQWITNQPEHLKHILEDISETRQHVEENIVGIKGGLAKFQNMVPFYQEMDEQAYKLLKKFAHSKQLCEINCQPQEVQFRSAIIGYTSDLYCGSIDVIHKTIEEHLEKLTDEYVQHLHEQIIKADHDYDIKVQNRVNELKDIALKEFGHTMYDILNLEDQYHHLIRDLKGFNTDHWFIKLKQLNIQLDSLLMWFAKMVEIYANYCKTCNWDSPDHESIEDRQQVVGNEKQDLLNLLIHSKFMEIYNNTETELSNIFQGLDMNLDTSKSNIDNLFISNLKPVQNEVTEITEKEIKAFNDLQIPNLKINIDLVKKLMENTEELMKAMQLESNVITAILNNLVRK